MKYLNTLSLDNTRSYDYFQKERKVFEKRNEESTTYLKHLCLYDKSSMLILQVVAREIVSPMEIDNRTRLNALYRIIVNVVAIGYP